MTTLYLTPNEKTMFDLLDKGFTKEVKVETETLTFQDSDEKRALRQQEMKLKDPRFRKIQVMETPQTEEDLIKLADSLDLSSLPEEDLSELAFAWGPAVFTTMIAVAMPSVKSAEDFQKLRVLVTIRHGLLLSFNS